MSRTAPILSRIAWRNWLCLSQIKSGHIGDAVRPGLGDKECARREARLRAHHLLGAAEKCDASVARLDQVASGEISALFVVAEDLGPARTLDIFIENDHASIGLVDRTGERAVIRMVGDENQPIQMVAAETLQIFMLAGALVERDAEHEGQAMTIGGALGGGGQHSEIGVRDIGNNETDGIRAAAAEAARMRVGVVAQRLDGAFDARRRAFRQLDAAIEMARNGSHGHAGSSRYVDQPRYRCWHAETALVNRLHDRLRPFHSARACSRHECIF